MSWPPTAKSAASHLISARMRSSAGPMLSLRATAIGRAGIPGQFPSHPVRPGSPWRQRLRWACGVCPLVDRFRVSSPATGVDTTGQTRSFSHEQIMAWARSWRAETGRWPTTHSGEIPGQGGLTWRGVDVALRTGRGGLDGRTSLLHFLTGKQHVLHYTPLTEEQILIWADAHHHRTGRWPYAHSGPVLDAPSETWMGISTALDPRIPQSSRRFVAQSTADQAPRDQVRVLPAAVLDSSNPRLGRRPPRADWQMA